MSQSWLFEKAWLPGGWQDRVLVEADQGVIRSVTPQAGDVPSSALRPAGYALPALVNVHSHAFQRAFAGLSEYRTSGRDSFWTWRELMYRFLETLTPEDVYRIGLRLYGEMRAAGYSQVGEFHYLLHQPGGTPYSHINEMADALIRAATESGIGICMLPVLYQRGGFDDAVLQGGQLRFGSSTDLYLNMLERLRDDWRDQPGVTIGVALHSLRAVSLEAAGEVLQAVDRILPGCPVHVHVAEQTAEVDDCVAATGKRPVRLLLDSLDVNSRWCLIHATHMTDDECRDVAARGAVVGVCPTTEANLGDGIFAARRFLDAGGRLAVGSDSHIAINPWEELRLLEYGQRLSGRSRAVLCRDDDSCGNLLYQWTGQGGCQATGQAIFGLQPGGAARLLLVDPGRFFQAIPDPRILDYLVFQSSLGLNGSTAAPFPD